MRASAAYRLQVAQNLLQRFWLETRPSAPLPAAATSVWSAMPHVDAAAPDRAAHREPSRSTAVAAPARRRDERRRRRAGAARRRVAGRTNRRTCTSPARRPTSTTCPSSPARCTRRSACRRSRTAACRRSTLDAIRAHARRGRRADRRRHPRPQRLRPDRPRRPDPRRRRGALPRPAGVRGDRRPRATPARRAAARAKEVLTIEPLPPVLTPREAHAAGQYVLPPMHLRARRRRAPRIAAAPHRLAGTLDVGGQEQFYLEGQISYAIPREDGGMLVHCSTQHPSEMQHLVAHALRLHAHHVQVECRRMGGGFGGKESQSALFACVAAVAAAQLRPAGQAAARPRRRLPDHRPAPLLPVRVRGRLRRRRPHPRRRADDGLARRPSRPTCPGPVMTRALCHFDNAYWLPDVAMHGYSAQDQHAEQHRVPRLRRAAGRDRDREHPRLRSRARSARTRSTCAAPTSTARTERNVTPYGQVGRRQHHPRAGRRAGSDAATTARAAPRSPRFNADEPGAQARPRADAGEVRHLVQRRRTSTRPARWCTSTPTARSS